MKKILLSVTGLLLFGLCANAQPWSFGPKAGVSFSTVNGVEGAKSRTGVVAGVFCERMVNDWFSIQTELLYSMNGFELKPETGTTKVHLDYISMPVITKFYLVSGLNLQLGASFGYLVNNNVKTDGESGNFDDQLNKYNVGVITGIAYDFNCGLVLEGRYNLGLSNIFSTLPDVNKVTTGSLQVAAGWKF